jgi:hypothetical protein
VRIVKADELSRLKLRYSGRWKQDCAWRDQIEKLDVGQALEMPYDEWRKIGYKSPFSTAVQNLCYGKNEKAFKVRRDLEKKCWYAVRLK